MVKVSMSLTDIFAYLGMRQRPLIEGESVFKAGHVILCQLENVEEVKILALVLQTSFLSAPPHEVKLSLWGNVSQWECTCSCKAGLSGYCKHVVATMIYINRYEEVELLSCTDITQKWGKEKDGLRQIYESTKITEFCHPQRKSACKRKFESTPIINHRNFEILVNSNSSSALFKFKNQLLNQNFEQNSRSISPNSRPNCSSESNDQAPNEKFCKKFRASENKNCKDEEMYKKIIDNIQNCSAFLQNFEMDVNWPENQCCKTILIQLGKDNIKEAAIDTEQSSDKWKKLRKLRITGSRCYGIYTYQSQDWNCKAKKYFWPKSFYNKYIAHGNKFEAHAISAYKIQNPEVEINHVGFIICQKFPWIGYSPDGIIFENGYPSKLLEVKCPFLGTKHNEMELATVTSYLETKNGAIKLK